MPEGTEEERKAKAARTKNLGNQKDELRKAFLPCNEEILKQGGWDDPKNIPAPAMLKSKVKDIVAQVALSETLFRIYSDTFVLNTLTEQEKSKLTNPEQVERVAEGAAKKGITPIRNAIDEYGFLIASKVNQKMAGSQLTAHDEAVLGSNIGQIIQAKNTTTENVGRPSEIVWQLDESVHRPSFFVVYRAGQRQRHGQCLGTSQASDVDAENGQRARRNDQRLSGLDQRGQRPGR